jgi:hypothetical protein
VTARGQVRRNLPHSRNGRKKKEIELLITHAIECNNMRMRGML